MTEDWYFARRHVNPDELISMKEIAELVGVSYWYVRSLNMGREKTVPRFPAPDVRFGRKPLWKRKTIADWQYSRHLRKQSGKRPQISDTGIASDQTSIL